MSIVHVVHMYVMEVKYLHKLSSMVCLTNHSSIIPSNSVLGLLLQSKDTNIFSFYAYTM